MITEPGLSEITEPANITIGKWCTEVESVTALDTILGEHKNLWTIYSEVCGQLIQPGYAQQDKSLRIDRILIPRKEFVELGWQHGAIGFECKKSGEKIGPPIAQSTDYSRSLFRLDNGVKIWLDMVFVWPMAPQHGPLASILYQQRVGSAYCHSWARLKLKLGEVHVLSIDREGTLEIGNAQAQRKAGCR